MSKIIFTLVYNTIPPQFRTNENNLKTTKCDVFFYHYKYVI